MKTKKFNAVQSWIDNVAYSHSKSENTEQLYRYGLNRFCEFIGKTPQQILKEYEGMTDREFRRKYARYVKALISYLTKDCSVGTVKAVVATIKSFFKYNDLPLGHIPTPARKVTFHNRDITKQELVKILEISRPRDKAFFGMMSQSGLRPDTLCHLRLKHVEPEFSKGILPCKIEIPEELAKGEFGSYFTFMGEESAKYLKAYLATRPGVGLEDYLFTSHGTDKKLDRRSISHIFRRAILKLKKKGIMNFEQKEENKPSEIRLYNLRKFFRKEAGKAGVEYVNFWMGHKTNYKAPHIPSSDMHYFSKEDVEFQRQLYKEKAMPFLRVETATPSETEETIMDLRKELERVSSENRDLRRKLEEFGAVENKVSQLEQDLREVKASRRGAVGPGAILGVLLTTTALDAKGTSKALQELVRKKAKALLQQIQKERGYRTEEEAIRALLKEITNGMLTR